jgi:hypothetical protein
MIHPDLVLTAIKHCDYPIFRATLKKYRDFFGKIIVFFNENNRWPYFDHFIHSEMADLGNIVFIDQVEIDWGTQDWRNVSTNEMLKYSSSEWVCSVEQDWFSQDWDELLSITSKAMETHDLVGWDAQVGDSFYIHPAYWFIKRSILEKTNKDFSARNGLDHFGWITRDVEGLGGRIFGLEKDGELNCNVDPSAHSFHLGGVNQNYLNWDNPLHVFHRAEAFMIYNYWCRKAKVGQSTKFLDISFHVEERLRKDFPDLDLENNEWRKFFGLA